MLRQSIIIPGYAGGFIRSVFHLQGLKAGLAGALAAPSVDLPSRREQLRKRERRHARPNLARWASVEHYCLAVLPSPVLASVAESVSLPLLDSQGLATSMWAVPRCHCCRIIFDNLQVLHVCCLMANLRFCTRTAFRAGEKGIEGVGGRKQSNFAVGAHTCQTVYIHRCLCVEQEPRRAERSRNNSVQMSNILSLVKNCGIVIHGS